MTGDLDEFAIAALLAGDAPVDTFGVGTKLVSGYAPPGFVFKLVAIEDGAAMRPVAKRSIGKLSSGSAKDAYRLYEDGVATTELIVARDAGAEPAGAHRVLSHHLVERGITVIDPSLERARATATAATAELPRAAFVLDAGAPALVSDVVVASPPTE